MKPQVSSKSSESGGSFPKMKPQESPHSNSNLVVKDASYLDRGSSYSRAPDLTPGQQNELQRFYSGKTKKVQSGDSVHEDSHSHHEKAPSILTAVISGIINWLLMFGLCCAYGMILFGDSWHLRHQSLGVKMNLFTACFVGLTVAGFSKIPVAIGGPDLNPVVFLGGIVGTIGESIAGQLSLSYPGGRRLGDWSSLAWGSRALGSASSTDVEFCEGNHLQANLGACNVYHEELRATAMFATAISSALLGVIFFCLGRFKLTRFVSYVPTSVMEAFLACVGYKVFKYALNFSNFQPRQFVPAALCGVTLYFVKALHVGNPAIMIPLFLFVPLGIFYCIIFGMGSDIVQARKDGYMFPELPDVDFWTVWMEGFGNVQRVNFKAWLESLPDLVIMLVVCLLDCLLKLAGTENKLKFNVDKDYEIQLHGGCNILTSLSFSSVGYMQLKFNIINYGVLGNLKDRRGGVVYAILCGAGFFGTIQYFNYMPRFFLSLLLFFAGAGFVAENLWGSRQYLTGFEWAEIIVILLVFVLTEKLLYAVVVGGLLTTFVFVSTAAEIPCVLGTHLKGGDFATIDRHEPVLRRNIEHITNSWLMVIRLKGYVFFGSAQSLVKLVREKMTEQETLPKFRRLRYLVFDCKLLDGMDASASKMMRVLADDAKAHHISFLWSSISEEQAIILKHRSVLKADTDWFETLTEALLFVEDRAMKYLSSMQEHWLATHPALALYQRVFHEQDEFEPFRNILTEDTMRHGCPWVYCSKICLEQHKTVLWTPGKVGVDLFLLHSGAVGLYSALPNNPDENGVKKVLSNPALSTPVAIYRHGWFLNPEALSHLPTQYYAVALENGEALSWSESQWYRMTHAKPAMATAISKAVMKQMKHDFGLTQKHAVVNAGGIEAAENAAVAHRGLLVKSKSFSDEATLDRQEFLPEEVKSVFSNLNIASVMEGYGFFDCPYECEIENFRDQKAILPELPRRYLRDLEIAFDTYMKQANDVPSGDAGKDLKEAATANLNAEVTKERDPVREATQDFGLPSGDVIKALKYVGVATTMFAPGGKSTFSYSDCMLLARCALMAPVNTRQVAILQQVFDEYDVDKSGELDLNELEILIQKTFNPYVSMEEVISLHAFWDEDRSGKIDIGEFRELLSRTIRQVEQEWSVLVGLRELIGDPQADITAHLTAKDLKSNSAFEISDEMAKEMLWAADWRTDAGGGSFLELRDVPTFLLLHTENKVGALPPPPHARHKLKPSEMKSGSHFKRSSSGRNMKPSEVPPDISDLVFDLRDKRWRGRALEETLAFGQSSPPRKFCSTVFSLHDSSDFLEEEAPAETPVKEKSCRQRFNDLLNRPESSKAARIWNFLAMFTVLLSFFVLFGKELISWWWPDALWEGLEIYMTAFFTLEFMLRLLFTDSCRDFIFNKRNVCDFIAVMPYYMESAFRYSEKWWALLRIIRISRAFRVLRVIRLPCMKGLSSSLGAIVTILAIIWGIYLKYADDDKK